MEWFTICGQGIFFSTNKPLIHYNPNPCVMNKQLCHLFHGRSTNTKGSSCKYLLQVVVPGHIQGRLLNTTRSHERLRSHRRLSRLVVKQTFINLQGNPVGKWGTTGIINRDAGVHQQTSQSPLHKLDVRFPCSQDSGTQIETSLYGSMWHPDQVAAWISYPFQPRCCPPLLVKRFTCAATHWLAARRAWRSCRLPIGY